MSFQNPVFIPGPTNIPEAVRKACDMPTIDHRSPLFGDILHPMLANVQKVLKSDTAEVFVFPASGTGGWEIALTNTMCSGDKVLAACNGTFSHRWIDMCTRHGLDMTVVDTAWMKKDLKHPALLMVDGVSSVASIDFRMDEWGVDVAVTGSQKGFMLPAGLAIVGFSTKAMAAVATATLPRTYFDLRDMSKGYDANAYPYTPSVGLMNGLKFTTDMLLEEGLDNVFARHARIADGVRAAVGAWGLNLCATSPAAYSNTVSAILTPKGFNATDVVSLAASKYGVAFGTGLGEVAGKVFR